MNSKQRRIARRRDSFYQFFKEHPETWFDLKEVCAALGCAEGKTSRAAMKGLRVLAERDGWWFPEATPAPEHKHKYILTKNPSNLIDAHIHVDRIGLGARKTASRRLDQIRENREQLNPGDRGVVDARLVIHEMEESVAKAAREAAEQLTKQLWQARREHREQETAQ